MSSRLLSWTDESGRDYPYWQTQDKKTLKRINQLIYDVRRSSFEGIGKPEPLKENLAGFWSRRIDDTNRLASLPSKRGWFVGKPCCSPAVNSMLADFD
ncbi:Txe/YoeB family addiction module toxin [Bowmanella sp. Y26]|uniref:Txe/YoeB family addiction module toxin n=1 Tax=Bowmanella yangjiangensis TaxID=2811230 RepID=UPI001BDD8CA5|nr:Txe/YoeB family addiction module toxin [Bowmanella yangjiangensis]MBT1062589.1 Txe/YoeB family addiction module toxin [Bowmanella yangjiangensis]